MPGPPLVPRETPIGEQYVIARLTGFDSASERWANAQPGLMSIEFVVARSTMQGRTVRIGDEWALVPGLDDILAELANREPG